MVEGLTVGSGGAIDGNGGMRVRTDLVNSGRFTNLAGVIEGNLINDGTPGTGDFAQFGGGNPVKKVVIVPGRLVNVVV